MSKHMQKPMSFFSPELNNKGLHSDIVRRTFEGSSSRFTSNGLDYAARKIQGIYSAILFVPYTISHAKWEKDASSTNC